MDEYEEHNTTDGVQEANLQDNTNDVSRSFASNVSPSRCLTNSETNLTPFSKSQVENVLKLIVCGYGK